MVKQILLLALLPLSLSAQPRFFTRNGKPTAALIREREQTQSTPVLSMLRKGVHRDEGCLPRVQHRRHLVPQIQ